jgi:uncharacterized RDD family membrane protein YckC
MGEKVGFWRRVGAYLIDVIVLIVIQIVVGIVFQGDQATAAGLNLVIGLVYLVAFWTYWNGQTVGNKVLGIRVVKTDGSPVTLTTAIIRYVGLLIASLPLLIGIIWVAFDANKQGWHDKIASTYVVKA